MKKKYVILLHTAFWVLYIVSNSYSKFAVNTFFPVKESVWDTILYLKYLLIEFSYALILFSCFYGSYLFIAPQLFLYKKYIKALVYSVLCLLFISGLRYALEYGFFLPVLGFDNYNGHPWPLQRYINNVLFYYIPSYCMYGIMYFFAENWYKNNRRNQELQKEKLTTELAFLRSQMNPHFLFNTINDIYALTYQKSEQAPEALLKLSAMLRYMVRDGNEAMMPLNREAEYIENIIALQRISAKGKAYIEFIQEGYIGIQPVASLLFVAFIENAFKHGVLSDPENPVNIYLQAGNEQIVFIVSNKKNRSYKDDTGGIGLSNVCRRLQLTYMEKYELIISDEDEFYKVNLVLKLN